MKHYKKEFPISKSKPCLGRFLNESKIKNQKSKIINIYHIDAYRVLPEDILNLGWNEIVSSDNIVIVEWPERIQKIIPPNAIWIKFKWKDKNKRELEF